jgi:hypothetical protein
MAEAVYVLCFLTSAAVAALLLRAWRRTRHRVLLWTGVGFLFLAADNLLLVLDYIVFPDTDLSDWRKLPALVGAALIVVGLIWDAE